MLFKRYINFLNAVHSLKLAINIALISFFLSACSAKPEADIDNDDETNKSSLEQKQIGTGQSTEVAVKQVEGAAIVPAKNLYLQQQLDNPLIIAEVVQKDYQQALSLMKEKKWPQAQTLFEQVIVAQPNLSGSYVNKAIIAKQYGEFEQSQLLLTKAIEVNKLNLYAHHLQGQLYRLQGAFEKSEQSYLAALAVWPDYAEANVSMAILLELYRGRLLEAHAYYRAYLRLKPDDEQVQRWLAGLEIKIKRAGQELPSEEPISAAQAEVLSTDKNIMAEKELSDD